MQYKRLRVLIVVAAILFLIIGSLAFGIIVKTVPFVIKIDNFFYVLINSLPHTTFLDKLSFIFGVWFLPWKIFFLPAFFYFLIIPFVVFMFLKKRKLFGKAILALVLAYTLATTIMLIDTRFVYRERPFLSLPSVSLSTSARSILSKVTSYPSGHVRDTVILVLIISYFVPGLRIPLFIFALFLGFDRIYSGEHYPTDVLIGAFLGYVIAKLSIFIIAYEKRI